MRQTIILLILITATNHLFACLSASQNRIFPLGVTSKGLVVVETHLQRAKYFDTERKIETMNPAWFGKSYLKIYDKNHKEVYAVVIDTIKQFQEFRYVNIIGESFKKGQKLAEKLPGFIAAKPISIFFCDYQEKCSKSELLFDTINNKVNIQLANKKKYSVHVLFDSTSIASDLLEYLEIYADPYLSAKEFQRALFINSVRSFQIADKKLTIVHIASGQKIELAGEEGTYPPGKEYEAKFAFDNIHKSVFEEPTLHHGRGFDFYIWE